MAKEYEKMMEQKIAKLEKIISLKKYQLKEIKKLNNPPSEQKLKALDAVLSELGRKYNNIVNREGIEDEHSLLQEESKYAYLLAKKTMYEDFLMLGNKAEVMQYYQGDIDRLDFKIDLYNQYKKKSSNPSAELARVNEEISDLEANGKDVPKELLWAQKSLNYMVTVRDNLAQKSRNLSKHFKHRHRHNYKERTF